MGAQRLSRPAAWRAHTATCALTPPAPPVCCVRAKDGGGIGVRERLKSARNSSAKKKQHQGGIDFNPKVAFAEQSPKVLHGQLVFVLDTKASLLGKLTVPQLLVSIKAMYASDEEVPTPLRARKAKKDALVGALATLLNESRGTGFKRIDEEPFRLATRGRSKGAKKGVQPDGDEEMDEC